MRPITQKELVLVAPFLERSAKFEDALETFEEEIPFFAPEKLTRAKRSLNILTAAGVVLYLAGAFLAMLAIYDDIEAPALG
jgi:hypothetical protein